MYINIYTHMRAHARARARARIRARVHTYYAINESGIPDAIVCDERSSKGIKHFHVVMCLYSTNFP